MNKVIKSAMLIFLFQCISITVSAAEAGIELVKQGKSTVNIIIPANASGELKASACLLSEYIEKSAAVKLPVITEQTGKLAGPQIYLGKTALFDSSKIATADLNDQGFLIADYAGNIIIFGKTDDAIEFGVYDFLERHLGVRWLFPGEIGEYVPKHQDIIIPAGMIKDNPAFLARALSPFSKTGNQQNYEWARRNRLMSPISFHHYLNVIFPSAKYGKIHPEFYPEINGKRKIPKDKATQGWQPCFSQPETVNIAAEHMNQIFEKNPTLMSRSLGNNDCGGYCECAACMGNSNKLNSLGIPSKSEAYYKWCNQVADKVHQSYPDKYFGMLAYADVIEPPDFKLDSSLIPYICLDRMTWVDPAMRKIGQDLNRRWSEKAANLGWYDYIYGSRSYVVPRLYFNCMAEYLRFGYRQNVKYYYAEAYPSADWNEGPKLYLTLKLLWNPNLDVDAALKEWCECAVGKSAANDLYKYYRFWEEFWTVRIPQSNWFKNNKHTTFLPYSGFGYLVILTDEDLKNVKSLLENMAQKAQTPAEQARAKFILQGYLKKEQLIRDYQQDFVALNHNLSQYKVTESICKNEFAKGLDKWNMWQRSYSKANVRFDAQTGHNEKGAIRFNLANSVKSPVTILKSFEVEAGKIYQLSAWVKLDNLPDNAQIQFIVKWKDDLGWIVNRKEGDIPPLASAVNISADKNEWKKLQMAFKAPTGGKYAIVFFQVDNAADGIVYFDDFMMEKIQK
jgi:hypothetical protein